MNLIAEVKHDSSSNYFRTEYNAGSTGRVFDRKNVDLLLEGTNFISPLPDHEKQSIVDQNIVLVRSRIIIRSIISS